MSRNSVIKESIAFERKRTALFYSKINKIKTYFGMVPPNNDKRLLYIDGIVTGIVSGSYSKNLFGTEVLDMTSGYFILNDDIHTQYQINDIHWISFTVNLSKTNNLQEHYNEIIFDFDFIPQDKYITQEAMLGVFESFNDKFYKLMLRSKPLPIVKTEKQPL